MITRISLVHCHHLSEVQKEKKEKREVSLCDENSQIKEVKNSQELLTPVKYTIEHYEV